ncbi:uncharacterized protein ACN427_006774 isoform 2-T3 [Glossina fuscipes fuscipes]
MSKKNVFFSPFTYEHQHKYTRMYVYAVVSRETIIVLKEMFEEIVPSWPFRVAHLL